MNPAVPAPPDAELRAEFVRRGCPIPPPHPFKIQALRAYLNWSRAKVFVETGTYKAETTQVMAQFCERVYSIELSPALFQQAQALFARRPHVTILQGDSATVLPEVLKGLDQPALFWLDGHWCGAETGLSGEHPVPVIQELTAIFRHPVEGHVIVIDDMRYFCGAAGYPTVDDLRRFVKEHRPDWVFDIAMDSLRLHAPRE